MESKYPELLVDVKNVLHLSYVFDGKLTNEESHRVYEILKMNLEKLFADAREASTEDLNAIIFYVEDYDAIYSVTDTVYDMIDMIKSSLVSIVKSIDDSAPGLK